MKNKSVLVVMVLMFAVAIAAGVVAGKLTSRLPATSADRTSHGSLTDVLNLNADQRTRMQAIWEGVQKTSQDCIDDAKKEQKAEDEKIEELLTPDQLQKYKQLTVEYQGKIGAIETRRNAAFQKAVADSLQLMTPEQQKLYNQIVEDRVGKSATGSLQASGS